MSHYELVQSVERALDILELVANTEAGITRQCVIGRTRLKNTTVYNLLKTLVAKRYLVKQRNPIRYHAGPVLLNIRRAQRDYELFQRAKPILIRLANTMVAGVSLCENVGLRTLTMLSATFGKEYVTQELHPTFMLPYGIGDVFYAYWDRQQIAEYERRVPFAKYGRRRWKSRKTWNKFLAEFRQKRVAMIPVRLTGGHFRVAAPVFGPRGDVVAIVCLIKPIEQTNAAFRHKCCEAVRKAGVELSFNG